MPSAAIVRGRVARRPPKNKPDDAVHAVSKGDDAPTIDAVLDGLESVVTELEGGDLPLEQALARFERGVALARQGSAMLDRVEERVEVLLAERDETVPFRPADDEAASQDDP